MSYASIFQLLIATLYEAGLQSGTAPCADLVVSRGCSPLLGEGAVHFGLSLRLI
jgi:hypothetical protein